MKMIEVNAVYITGESGERVYTRKTTLNLDRFILVHEDFSRPKERSYIFYDSGEGEGGFTVDETYESLIQRIEFLSQSEDFYLLRDFHNADIKADLNMFKASSKEGEADV